MSIKSIITHGPGGTRAHFDDFVSSCIALYLHPLATVFRVDSVSDACLNNPNVIVFDIGFRYEPEKNNFDHHQDGELRSSLILYLNHLGIQKDAHNAFPSLAVLDASDVGGRSAVVKTLGLKDNSENRQCAGILMNNPIATYVLNDFGKCDMVTPNDRLHTMMVGIGDFFMSSIKELKERRGILRKYVEIKSFNSSSIYVDLTKLPHDIGNPELGVKEFLNEKRVSVDFYVVRDPRSTGTRIVRGSGYCNFLKYIELYPDEIEFGHKSGFLMVLKKDVKVDISKIYSSFIKE